MTKFKVYYSFESDSLVKNNQFEIAKHNYSMEQQGGKKKKHSQFQKKADALEKCRIKHCKSIEDPYEVKDCLGKKCKKEEQKFIKALKNFIKKNPPNINQ